MSEALTVEDLGFVDVARSEMSVDHAVAVAAVLDRDIDLLANRELPFLWHWAYFAHSVPSAALGTDGHPPLPLRGPTAGLPRRMWAGGRVIQHHPLVVGTSATRRSSITRAERKAGRSGDLLVVTVCHEIEQDGAVRINEEQDLVYRAAPSGVSPRPLGDVSTEPPEQGWVEIVKAGPALLFRFSAVTFNSHRIHYDVKYATDVEGYPGLVVHGPLTALLLAESALRHGRTGVSFSFRASAPLFATDAFALVGQPDGAGTGLRAVRNDGTLAMEAKLSS